MSRKLIFLMVAVTLLSCSNKKNNPDGKPIISVSILPQKYFIEEIAGDLFSINVMIPPGSSPATYEPTTAQLASLAETDLYMKIGYTGFELSWMDKLISVNKNMTIADLSEGVDLIMEKSHQHGSHSHGSVDPHIWLSPANVKIISSNIVKALTGVYPEYAGQFNNNYQEFSRQLDSLDRYIESELKDLESRNFMTYHPSLSYFARDYKLEQYPIELEGKEPSPAYLKELVDLGKSESIGIIFLQMQFDQHNAQVLAREIGAEIIQIDPLDPEWFQQMIFIAKKLNSSFK